MSQYNRHAIATLEEVIPLIFKHWDTPGIRVEFGGHEVTVSSTRLKTFAKASTSPHGMTCVACGLAATFFSVDTFLRGNQGTPHLNLFGVNKHGHEVLFTHDHTVARALGGQDDLSNTTLMCSPCNNKKGNKEGHIVNELRYKEKMKNRPKAVDAYELVRHWSRTVCGQDRERHKMHVGQFIYDMGWTKKSLIKALEDIGHANDEI